MPAAEDDMSTADPTLFSRELELAGSKLFDGGQISPESIRVVRAVAKKIAQKIAQKKPEAAYLVRAIDQYVAHTDYEDIVMASVAETFEEFKSGNLDRPPDGPRLDLFILRAAGCKLLSFVRQRVREAARTQDSGDIESYQSGLGQSNRITNQNQQTVEDKLTFSAFRHYLEQRAKKDGSNAQNSNALSNKEELLSMFPLAEFLDVCLTPDALTIRDLERRGPRKQGAPPKVALPRVDHDAIIHEYAQRGKQITKGNVTSLRTILYQEGKKFLSEQKPDQSIYTAECRRSSAGGSELTT